MKKRLRRQKPLRLSVEELEKRHMLSNVDLFHAFSANEQQTDSVDIAFATESAWRLDANNDRILSPIDALTRITLLNSLSQPIYVDKSFEQGLWDANGDGQLTPGDVLATINALNNEVLFGSIENTREIAVSVTETATQDIDVAPGTHDVVMSSVNILASDFVFIDIAQSISPSVTGNTDSLKPLRLYADIDHDGEQELLGINSNPKVNDFYTPTDNKLIPLEPGTVTTFTILGNANMAQNPIVSVAIGSFRPKLVTYSGGYVTSQSYGKPGHITIINPKPTVINDTPIEVRLGDTNVLLASATFSGPPAKNLFQCVQIHVTGDIDWSGQEDIEARFWLTPTLYDVANSQIHLNTNSINWVKWDETGFYDFNLFNSLKDVEPNTVWEVRGTFADNETTINLFVGLQWRVEFLDMSFHVTSYGPWNRIVA